ncbi:hypothetical protein JYQ62_16995 [Nostoc sp. UHCC 0702]|nr:hypothetical protein JYQ62_16995 [Nostoc sp. UHCC 0702]
MTFPGYGIAPELQSNTNAALEAKLARRMIWFHPSASAASTVHIYDCSQCKKVTGIVVCRFFHQQLNCGWHKNICHAQKVVRTLAVPTFIVILF